MQCTRRMQRSDCPLLFFGFLCYNQDMKGSKKTTAGKSSFAQKRTNKTAALAGALGALTVLLTATRLGFIPWFTGAAITVLHVPVILAVCLTDAKGFAGLWAGLGVALVFGLSSLVYAVVSPSGPIDPFFQNPLISVLPRLLFALCVFFLYKGLSFFNRSRSAAGDVLIIALTAFLGTAVHAFFVLGALVIAGAIPPALMWAVLVSNTLAEAAAAVVLTSAAAASFKGLSKRKVSKLNSNAGVE